MSKKPENNFIAKIHKQLPLEIYREKMHNAYRGGTPDCYYEGIYAFWIEYKWLNKLPKEHKLALTQLQLRWLYRNAANGHSPWVILGTPEGGIIYDAASWEDTIPRATLEASRFTVPYLVEEITKRANEILMPTHLP